MRWIAAAVVLIVSIGGFSHSVDASDTGSSGSLRLEIVAELPAGAFEIQAIRGDFAVVVSPFEIVERWNYRTEERIAYVGPPGSHVLVADMSDGGEMLLKVDPDRSDRDDALEWELWNPDTGQRDALADPGEDSYRFSTAGAVERIAERTDGIRLNASQTLSRRGDVYTLADGTMFTTPARGQGTAHWMARDVPVVLLFSTSGTDRLTALWDLTTGQYDEMRSPFVAVPDVREEPVLFTITRLSPDGTHAVATYGNRSQKVVRLVREADSIYFAGTVEEVVNAADFDRTAHAGVLRLYQAIFGRYPDLGGAKYWIRVNNGIEDGTPHGVLAIAGFMSGSEEWSDAYRGSSDERFLQTVYSNVLGRDFDQAGYNYWLDLLRGTNEHGGNPTGSQLERHEIVFYVTANPEFGEAYPFQPVSEPVGTVAEAVHLLASAPAARIQLTSWSELADGADPVIEKWERASTDGVERYSWDFRGLVDPWLHSRELADDVDNLLPLIVGDEPSDAGVYLALPALRAVSWSYEGECLTRGEVIVRTTLDDSAPQTLAAIVERMPRSDLWRDELLGDGFTSADIGPGWDSSRPWVEASKYDLQPCLSAAGLLSSFETAIVQIPAEDLVAEYDGRGRLTRLVFVEETRRLFPAEYSPVHHELVVSYEVDPASFEFPVESDVHP